MSNKETINDAARDYANYNEQMHKAVKDAVKFGAKWQAEQDSNWFNEYQEVENYIINKIGNNFLDATPEKYETASQATIALLESNWQAERMYSEEDLRKAYLVGKHGGINQTYFDFDEWVKQLKKQNNEQ
jgi:uncharacterized protein (DUF1330 family)